MPEPSTIQPDRFYTFTDYVKLNFAPRDILAYFNVTQQRQGMDFPQHQGNLDRLADLEQRIQESLPQLNLTSNAARREFLIAPELTGEYS